MLKKQTDQTEKALFKPELSLTMTYLCIFRHILHPDMPTFILLSRRKTVCDLSSISEYIHSIKKWWNKIFLEDLTLRKIAVIDSSSACPFFVCTSALQKPATVESQHNKQRNIWKLHKRQTVLKDIFLQCSTTLIKKIMNQLCVWERYSKYSIMLWTKVWSSDESDCCSLSPLHCGFSVCFIQCTACVCGWPNSRLFGVSVCLEVRQCLFDEGRE